MTECQVHYSSKIFVLVTEKKIIEYTYSKQVGVNVGIRMDVLHDEI
jgi:hypothetical protein